MRIKISKSAILIQGIGLHVQTGRINMRAQNVHALLNRSRTDPEHQQRLIHSAEIDPIAFDKFLFLLHQTAKFLIALPLNLVDDIIRTFPFGLSFIEEIHIRLCISIYLLQFRLRV